mgnify:CR=1 FL=1|jgi:hypothetical protein
MNNTNSNSTTTFPVGSNLGGDPGPKGDMGLPGELMISCRNITDISSIPSFTISTEGICSSPYTYNNYTITKLPMSEELYLYITGGKACVSTMPPTWNEQGKCLWHAKWSRVLSIEGDYGLSRLIKSYIGSELDVIYTYLTINGFNVYATILGPSGELFVEKAPIKGKENLIHRSRKK